MSRGVAGGRVASKISDARGGSYVGGKPDSPEQAVIREAKKQKAQKQLTKLGICWVKGVKK